jgi:uncharacterized coiled-coil DUF342 family protein
MNLVDGVTIRGLKDELNEAVDELNELRRERVDLRSKLTEIMNDFRVMQADVKGKQRLIDRLEAELRR